MIAHAPVHAPLHPPITLSDTCFRQIRDLIYQQTGLYFHDNKQYLLESRLARRVTALGLDDFSTYLRLIESGTGSEFAEFIEAITINETYFFRNIPQLEVLEQGVLPALIRDKMQQRRNQINIWSAACSSGEEPYSVALLIKERVGPLFPQITFRIVGSDIDTKVLDAARKGVYGKYAVRQLPMPYLMKYFAESDELFTLRSEVREMVEFRQLNLYDQTAMHTMRSFDVVICANVLIYFDAESKQQVVRSLCDSLNPGGVLFLGFSEFLHAPPEAFRPVHYAKTLAYRKN